MKKILTIIIVLSLLAITGYPQATTSATVSATIIEPISISKTVQSDLRNVAVIVTGSVAISPAGMVSKSNMNILKLPVATGTITVASYTFGSFGYNYTFELPSRPLTVNVGTKKMKIDSYDTSNPSNCPEPGLIAGVYVTFTPYNLTVNYN